jgi:hypothetical protein
MFTCLYIHIFTYIIGGQNYGHYLDGDGYITRISFAQGKAHFMSKFVRTDEYVRESEEGEVLFRRYFMFLCVFLYVYICIYEFFVCICRRYFMYWYT